MRPRAAFDKEHFYYHIEESKQTVFEKLLFKVKMLQFYFISQALLLGTNRPASLL
jgi:hypothetical protein